MELRATNGKKIRWGNDPVVFPATGYAGMACLLSRAHADAIEAVGFIGCARVGHEEGVAGARHVIRKHVGKPREKIVGAFDLVGPGDQRGETDASVGTNELEVYGWGSEHRAEF